MASAVRIFWLSPWTLKNIGEIYQQENLREKTECVYFLASGLLWVHNKTSFTNKF